MSAIAIVLGTRPEIIKIWSLVEAAHKAKVTVEIYHTNQHYDAAMDANFFEELGLPAPAVNLHVGSGSHGVQTAKMLQGLEQAFLERRPGVVVVQGDTNSVLAGALAAAKLGIPVAHVEAGLRSFDRAMPEELNRIMTDHISDYLFPPTQLQHQLLIKEGIDAAKVHVVGNTIVDAVGLGVARAVKLNRRQELGLPDSYLLLTCHRPSNTDSEASFLAILQAAQELARSYGMPVYFPMHPRLAAKRALVDKFPEIHCIAPLGYLDMLTYTQHARLVLTDSGGIQEEACILQTKCLVLRTTTERPETLEVGGAELVAEVTLPAILAAHEALKNREVTWRNPFGDGRAGERIISVLASHAHAE